MNVFPLILKEIRHRKLNSLLALLGIAVATALYVGFFTTGAAADRETTRLMRDIGFNLRIVPRGESETALLRRGHAENTMPEEYADRFANQPDLSYEHLTLTLKRWTRVGETDLLVTGIRSMVSPRGGKKKPMIFQIDPGTTYLGFHVARQLGLEPGGMLELEGHRFEVAQCLNEAGNEDDATVFLHLQDAQLVLGEAGRINEIQAIECLCRDPNVDSIDILRAELERVMPEAKVIQKRAMAKARESQRLMMEAYFAFAMQGLLVACALWIAVLAILNLRERRDEIGILRALGFGASMVAVLFLGKAILLGIAGAALGFAAGSALALWAGPSIFEVTAAAIEPEYALLREVLWAAPLFAACCTLVPAALAATQDPAQTLRED